MPYTSEDEVAKHVATDQLVAWLETQSKDRSGIWRDIAIRHRPTEVHTHYREVLAIAAASALKTPLLSDLLKNIYELEQAGTMSEDRLTRLAAVVA